MMRRTVWAEWAWAALAVLVVGMLVVPVPTPVLDLLVTANLAVSLLVLLVAAQAAQPRQLVSFPALLLATTLARVAINVSSTRLILLQADAGRVIESFGNFVVAGNFVVGVVVFAVITIVQYLVIARGAERVAEVGARFALDAMPGQQLGIDAELRAGAIHPEEARRRRAALARDSQFFGAMDGAMKFVRGDAIAIILIVIVNIVGGLAIGVFQRDMPLADAARVYSVLTIGEGLAAQIPALLTSVAAGLVVTRISDGEAPQTSTDVRAVVAADPRLLAIVAGLFLLLALIPGMPALPFLALAAVGAAGFVIGRRRAKVSQAVDSETGTMLELRIGSALKPIDGDAVRDAVERELGFRPPTLVVVRDFALQPTAYQLSLAGVPLARGVVAADRLLLNDDAHGLAALTRDAVVTHAQHLLGIQETRRLLDGLHVTHPSLVREVVPKIVPLPVVADVLRRLLSEGVSIRTLRDIVETLGAAGSESDAAILTERVRRALRRQITHRYAPEGQAIDAWRLDPMIEDALRGPPLEPELAEDLLQAVRRCVATGPSIIVTSGDIRRQVRHVIERDMPELTVLAYQELLPSLTVRSAGQIQIT